MAVSAAGTICMDSNNTAYFAGCCLQALLAVCCRSYRGVPICAFARFALRLFFTGGICNPLTPGSAVHNIFIFASSGSGLPIQPCLNREMRNSFTLLAARPSSLWCGWVQQGAPPNLGRLADASLHDSERTQSHAAAAANICSNCKLPGMFH